jgi:hypothetical protein
MRKSEALALTALPRGSGCSLCGAPVRFSHTEYLGRGETLAMLRCSACGAQFRGALRESAAADAEARRPTRRGRERSLPDGGAPDNPVIDSTTAELLRKRFGGF